MSTPFCTIHTFSLPRGLHARHPVAAGRGLRMQQPQDTELPKCLLRFGAEACSSGTCSC